jgi:hypothetical protein
LGGALSLPNRVLSDGFMSKTIRRAVRKRHDLDQS